MQRLKYRAIDEASLAISARLIVQLEDIVSEKGAEHHPPLLRRCDGEQFVLQM